MPATAPQFVGWEESKSIYRRSTRNGGRSIVGRFDGWNWGYLVLDDDGRVISGRTDSAMDVWRAIQFAEAAIVRGLVPQ